MICPETATELIANGIAPSEAIPGDEFQDIMFRKQLAKEDLYRHIQKVPSKAREYIPETEIDHIYVALSNDFIPPKQGVKLWARGFVYEYLSRGKKNIGIQVLTLMEVKEEMP